MISWSVVHLINMDLWGNDGLMIGSGLCVHHTRGPEGSCKYMRQEVPEPDCRVIPVPGLVASTLYSQRAAGLGTS